MKKCSFSVYLLLHTLPKQTTFAFRRKCFQIVLGHFSEKEKSKMTLGLLSIPAYLSKDPAQTNLILAMKKE